MIILRSLRSTFGPVQVPLGLSFLQLRACTRQLLVDSISDIGPSRADVFLSLGGGCFDLQPGGFHI